MKGRLAIVKDGLGLRLEVVESFDGIVYKFESGFSAAIDSAFPADQGNLRALAQGQDMHKAKDTWMMPLKAHLVMEDLSDRGFGVDEQSRIKRRLHLPFIEVTASKVKPLLEAHVTLCEKGGQDPEKTMLTMAWNEESKEVGLVLGPIATPVPEMEGGSITIYDGRVAALTSGDWTFVPKRQANPVIVTGSVYKFMKTEPANVQCVKDLLVGDKFLTEDGIICKSGAHKFLYKNMGVDDILGGGK